MKKYTHLVFDIDGTLVDTAKINMVSLHKTLKRLRGEAPDMKDLYFSFGIPGEKTMEILGFEDPKAALEEWEKDYLACGEELGVELFPGMREVLEKLAAGGVSLGIITSKTRYEYEHDFQRRGLDQYFSTSITVSDSPKGKPNPDPMLEYLRQTGASPEETLYFGDSVYDMQCAAGAGVDHALVLWGCLLPEGIEATYRLEKPEEILNFAEGL